MEQTVCQQQSDQIPGRIIYHDRRIPFGSSSRVAGRASPTREARLGRAAFTRLQYIPLKDV